MLCSFFFLALLVRLLFGARFFCRVLFVVCCLLFVVCRVLFVVCCLMVVDCWLIVLFFVSLFNSLFL